MLLRAVVMIAAGAFLTPQSMLRAQDCSRNMLSISSPGSYVVTQDVQALHLTKGFTIECWAKIGSGARLAALVDKGSPLQYCYGLFLDTGLKVFGGIRNSNPLIVQSDSIDSLQNWHHYAFVFVPNDSVRLYIDTVEIASQSTKSISSIDSSTDSLRIGMNANGLGMVASIDEVRIWNLPRALSSIRSTLFHTIPGSDSGLVLYYSFDDETQSKRVHDFSGHGRDGFIRGPDAEIVQSTSPILDESPGYRLSARETSVIIPEKRCSPSFDTVVHLRNLGSTPLNVNSISFLGGKAFSVTPNSPFTLPADSNYYATLLIHFGPNAGGVYTDTLYVSSTDDCAGVLRIGVHAIYDSVGLVCTPSTLNFGAVTQCNLPQTEYVTVVNTSSTDSESIVSSQIPSGSGIKILTPLPIELNVNGSARIAIQLANGSRGPVSATVSLDLDKCSREASINVTATRQFAGLSMPASINLGVMPSTLAGVRLDSFVIVTNNGDVPDAIRALSSSDSILQILDGRISHFIFPGDTLHIPIELIAKGCGTIGAKLSIQSEVCSVDTSAYVSVYLTPPLPLTAQTLDAGIQCVPLDTTFFVRNPNDIPVVLDTILYSSPLLFFNPPLSFPETIPAHDSAIVNLRFFPSVDGDFVDTAYLQMSPCGEGIVILSGEWGYKGLSFNPPILDFGRGCKTDTVTEEVMLTNSSPRTDSFSNNSYTGSFRFLIDPFSIPLPLVLHPGDSKQIFVTYTPVLGALDTGTFQLISDEGCPAADFHLRGSREIAKAAWTLASGEFDTVCPGNTSDKIFDLADQGLDSIDVISASVTGAGFSLVKSPAAFAGTGHFTVQFAPAAEQDYSGNLTLTLDSCGTSVTLPLHGSGGPLPSISLSDTAHNFDSVLVGDSVSYCLTITNPSCDAITISADTSLFSGTQFKLNSQLSSVRVARGDTIQLCIQFRPSDYGIANATLTLIADSVPARTISLTGLGLSPVVLFNPHLVDFGYVLHGESKTLVIHDSNAGNFAAAITQSHNDFQDFIVKPPANLAPQTGSFDSITFRPQPQSALVYDTVHYLWSGHSDSVILRGFGTDSGLLASAVGLDFGNVHIGADSTIPLYLFALIGTPTIDSIGGMLIPADTFSAVADSQLPYTIKNDQDSLTVHVTYHANLEQADTGYLVVYFGTNSDTIRLVANGVEAHPHVSPDTFSVSGVTLGTQFTGSPFLISNRGDYPFYINSVTLSDPSFAVSAVDPATPITKSSPLPVTVTFTPTRTRKITALLQFQTSYRDSALQVVLIGSGAYPAGEGPSFGYSVASRTQEEPGEYDTIPITMSGINLDKIDADSLVLDMQFDSDMVRMIGADGGSADMPVAILPLNAGAVKCAIVRSTFAAGTVMRLYTQALLGPHPYSIIQVNNPEPAPDRPESVGAFDVLDCGGPVNGVVFAGPYGTNAIVPNPASDHASLTYQIGFDGPVTVDVYNSIGQFIESIDAGAVKTGTHSLDIDVSDLPQGRYVYRLKSLDYHAEGALVIMR